MRTWTWEIDRGGEKATGNRGWSALAMATMGIVALSLTGASTEAAVWNNSGTDFNDGESWVDGLLPTGGVAQFDSAPITQPGLSADISVGQLNFATGVSGYTLGGAGKLTMTSATAILAQNNSGTNTITAPVELGRAAGNTFSQTGGGTLAISGNITEANAGTVLNLAGGSSIYHLSGDNSYTGGTNIGSSNIRINILGATALGSARISVGANNPTFDNTSGGALTITNDLQWTAAVPAMTFAGASPLTLSGNVALDQSTGATTTITVSGSSVLTLSGQIIDNGGGKNLTTASTSSPGTLVLAGNNTYGGTTLVGAIGTLRIAHDNALGSTANGTTLDGILEMTGGITVTGEALQTKGTLKNISGDNEWAGAITIYGGACVFQSDTGTLTISGDVNGDTSGRPVTLAGEGTVILSGSIGSNVTPVAKHGGGLAILSGSNQYIGATNVSAGTLLVNGTHTGGDDYNVGAGGTLGGTGMIALQSGKTISVTGTLAPGGESLGSLTVDGNVVINSTGRMLVRVNAVSSDLLAVSGDLTLADGGEETDLSRLDISGTLGGIAEYTLATYGGTLSGTFDEVYFNDALVLNPEVGGIGDYKLVYGAASGGDVRLVLVPEPASVTALLLAGGAGLLARHRSRRC